MFAITSPAARRATRAAVGIAAAAALTITIAGCTPAPTEAAGSSDPLGVDDGTTLTMWSRSATETQSQAFVDAYNASHENQVERSSSGCSRWRTTPTASAQSSTSASGRS